uniref:G-protein coupled receptors family 1 profile domain-containing protein n=1 Tax=Gouania willdenowi TaxID=441366 RepID=A0A8C5DIY2_GOUWI
MFSIKVLAAACLALCASCCMFSIKVLAAAYLALMCYLYLFLLAANRASGIFFLTAVAMDRYLRIVYALWVSLGLWVLIFLATGHLLADEHFFESNNRMQCESFNICTTPSTSSSSFCPPPSWLSAFVLAVALIFITCFLPNTMSRLSLWILKVWYDECSCFEKANVAFYTSECFTYFNSVLNPVVYYFSTSSPDMFRLE